MENTTELQNVTNAETTEITNTNPEVATEESTTETKTEVVTSELEATENAEAGEETKPKREPFNPLANYKDMPINKEALEAQNVTLAVLKTDLEKLVTLAENTEDFKLVRKSIIELKEKILALFLISKAEKDVLIDRLQQSFNVLNEKQEAAELIRKKQAEEKAKNLEERKKVIEEKRKAAEDKRNKLIEERAAAKKAAEEKLKTNTNKN